MVDLGNSLDEDSLHIKSLKSIREQVMACTKKDDLNCYACTNMFEIKNIQDYVVTYSSLINCIVRHCRNMPTVEYEDIFCAEMFLLPMLCEPARPSIHDELRGEYDKYDKIREDITVIAEKYYANEFSEFTCEMDVESMMYKIFSINPSVDTKDRELLLIILYMRKESERFFKVYFAGRISSMMFRLAILLSLSEECEKSTELVIRKSKDLEGEKVSYIDFNEGNIKNSVGFLSEILALDNVDIDSWIQCTKSENDWYNKVRMWRRNRHDFDGSVDKSMLEECLKLNRYDDGWYIYKLGHNGVKSEFHKLAVLCINAIKASGEEIWVRRLLDVITSALNKNEVDLCCTITEDIFEKIGTIDEKYRSIILREFIKKINKMEKDEKVIRHMLKGISGLCKECKNTETCDLCVEHANHIYREWKKNNTGGFFYKHHSQYENEIYENMMEMCDTIEDCDGFRSVCKDIVNNEAKIDRGMSKRIQRIHNKMCKNCNYKSTRIMEVNEGRNFLFHIFNEFHL